MNIRTIITSGLITLLVASTSNAQPVSWRAFAERVGPKSLVVVQLTSGRRVEGHIVQVTEKTVSVLLKTRIPVPVRQFSFADIQSIVIEREGWSPGAKVLMTVGTVAGIMAAFTIAVLAGSK